MVKYTGRMYVPIAIGLFAIVSACGGDKNKADTTLAADSTLNADLAMAGSDTGAQPQLRDVPASGTKSTPSTSSSSKTTTTTRTSTKSSGNKVAAGGGGGRTHAFASGTVLQLAAGSQLCTNTGHVGDSWVATTTQAVHGEGSAVIPAGARVTLRPTQLKRSENVRDKIVMAFEVVSVQWGGKSYPLSGTVAVPSASITRVRNEPKSADVKKVIGGAAIGAIAGQVLGKSTKSTVIGGAVGAAAGAGAAVATANYEGCINAGAPLTVTLSQQLNVVSAARVREGMHRHVGM
jgi:hypothetical protein